MRSRIGGPYHTRNQGGDVWLKVLVVHGAEWGKAGSILTRILKDEDNSRQFKEYVTRLLGYGAVDINRV